MLEEFLKCGTQLFCGNDVLAGNPRGRSLIFSAIGDLALFAAGQKIENDLFTAVEPSSSAILGGGKDQPMASQNFVGPVLGEDLIAAV